MNAVIDRRGDLIACGTNHEGLGAVQDDDQLDLEGTSPGDRVNRYLTRRAYQIVGFGGVIRTAQLRALGGLPAFYGGDVLLGVRLALLGDLVQVPEQLYNQRRHDHQPASDPG